MRRRRRCRLGAGKGRYRLSGDKELRPSAISDDGRHTYIQWPRDRSLPAVYAIGARPGDLVNGGMRDDIFVIDSVSRRSWSSGSTDHVARADRVAPRGRP
jgi:type IV secretion system protein VirB9